MNHDEIIRLIDQGLTMRARELLIAHMRACACGALWPVASDTTNEPFKRCPTCS